MLWVPFFGKIRKQIFRFFGETQNRIMNAKYLHSRRIFRIKSKSGFFRFLFQAFPWERIRKKYICQAVSLWYYSSSEQLGTVNLKSAPYVLPPTCSNSKKKEIKWLHRCWSFANAFVVFLDDKKHTSRHVFQIPRTAHATYFGYSI